MILEIAIMKMFRVVVNGSEYKVGIEELTEESSVQPSPVEAAIPATPKPKAVQPSHPKPKQPSQNLDQIDGTVAAPMPGTVIKVSVGAGDTVYKGQTILVLEAMKMENEIMAPKDGTIKEVKVSEGTSVNAGDVLIVLAS